MGRAVRTSRPIVYKDVHVFGRTEYSTAHTHEESPVPARAPRALLNAQKLKL